LLGVSNDVNIIPLFFSHVKSFFVLKNYLCVINYMHTQQDLYLLLDSLTEEATEKGFNLLVENTVDDHLFVIANPKTRKVACIGLIDINGSEAIVAYSIRIKRWGWYNEEGFELDMVVETKNIRDDIFRWLPTDDIITYLHE
tara:strand:- start:3 stop:428 length:426 start_codon:yes stop_codon:yes gene_type:complete